MEDASQYEELLGREDACDLLRTDLDLGFLDEMFAEDLFQGLDHILDPQLFPDETNALLDDVHFEARLLFGVYMAFLLQLFYSSLFQRTIGTARLEVSKAREYARTLPLHVWTATRPRHPKHFCMCNNGHAEPEEHAAEDE
mmetsp:Transcript_1936/g.4377  ORF Transcript_1936/g.4377 Transcript_1936/m.4377 type:complete len:141 (+) Transcript_1936:282-704(+)